MCKSIIMLCVSNGWQIKDQVLRVGGEERTEDLIELSICCDSQLATSN